MRRGIFAHLNAGGAGLKPITVKALQDTSPKSSRTSPKSA